MNIQAQIDGVLAWVRETLPELVGGYSHIVLQSTEPLPDVIVDCADARIVREDARFPTSALQQVFLVAYDLELSFMVDNSDPQAAAETLRDFADRLAASLLADGTLGGTVQFISPLFGFDFTPPFVERPDGTRGREMTMQMTAGELVQEAM